MIWICITFAIVACYGLFYSIMESDGVTVLAVISSSIFTISIIGIICIGIPEEPKEYPATEYTLEYKITAIGEQSDTTYVLTKIKENDNR